MARFLLGEEPVSVTANASVLVDPEIGDLGDYDSANVLLETASGRQCVISNSRRATYGYDQRIEVLGADGAIAAENQRPVSVEIANADGFTRPPLLNFFMTRYTAAYANEIAAFIDAVKTGKPAAPSGEDGLAALALLVAAAWYAKRPGSLHAALAFGLGAIAVWTAHIMGWAILLFLVASAELAMVRSWRDLVHRALRAAPLILPIVPLLVWHAEGGGRLFWYAPHLLQAKAMNFVTALKGLSMPFDLAITASICLGAILAFLWAGGRRLEPRLAAGGGLLLFATLVLPTTVLGSWGADLRLAPVAMMVTIMAIRPAPRPERERLLIMLGASLFVLRAGWTSVHWRQADHVLQKRLVLLDEVPRGSRLGFLSVEAGCDNWALTPNRKLGAYAITRRDAFGNTLFQIPGSDVMTIRQPPDRARWFDGSQDIPVHCPEGAPDRHVLGERMRSMAQADFNALWIAGIDSKSVPRLPGYAIVYSRGIDTLLIKQASEPPEPGSIPRPQSAIRWMGAGP